MQQEKCLFTQPARTLNKGILYDHSLSPPVGGKAGGMSASGIHMNSWMNVTSTFWSIPSSLTVSVGKTTAGLLQKIDLRVAITRRVELAANADQPQTNHSTPDTSERPTGVLHRMTQKCGTTHKHSCLSDEGKCLHSHTYKGKQSPEQPDDTAARCR